MHEVGHTLGLKHPGNCNGKGSGDPPFLPVSEDNRTNTVMSYYGIRPGTLGTYDLAAIQYLYGPNSGVRPGNDLHRIAPGAPGQYIWDGGGNGGDALIGSTRAHFITLLGGNDAADGQGGDDVLDGGFPPFGKGQDRSLRRRPALPT